MTATRTSGQTSTSSTGSTFAGRLRAAVEQAQPSVPEHRRARDWHGSTQHSVANPRRTRGLVREDATGGGGTGDFATRLRRAVG
ncbi:hypothetical protein [Nocardioides marmoribigeumensis]|jgi:hypothetical protein|uniref:Uncharacterized protein n=1 Tax=Nocardioides marmoribigeumensis TaxID=433649 RepID=A0ABU2C0C4_9ACTN|nr:hypothetical protein [Nocardioides marmoribigeumensis]MDR7364110.1 hypothetical protein [Nocardioides marmoribigeumensis]